MFPRLLGALAALWAVRLWVWPSSLWLSLDAFLLAAVMFTVAAIWLLSGRHIPVGAGLLVVACLANILGEPSVTNSPVVLMGWAALIVLMTDGQPSERAVLLRVCVTCVYGFTALAKINPAFLAGDQMVRIATSREHMGWALDLLSGPTGVAIAWATVATEAGLAVALWFPRTRTIAASVGFVLHLALVPVATTSWGRGVLFLMVLNFGLVAMYPAFWHPLKSRGLTPSDGGAVFQGVPLDGDGQ